MKILHISSSARIQESKTRKATSYFLQELAKEIEIDVIERDLSSEMSFINETFISGSYLSDEQRTLEQKATLALSNMLVQELQEADIYIFGIPIYNFTMPASLKAWADMVARLNLTFSLVDNKMQGLLKNKKAYAIIASADTKVGSEADFLTPWFRHFMGFIGVQDVCIMPIEQLEEQIKEKIILLKKDLQQEILR